ETRRVPRDLIVAAEELAGDRVGEGLTLAEDRVLLALHRAAAGADVEENLGPLHRDHHRLDGREGFGEVDGHHPERPPDAVGNTGRDRMGQEQEQRQQEPQRATKAPQNVTEGWWIPKTARSRSQISPSDAVASTASTSRGIRFTRPRGPVSRASSARGG